MKIKFPADEDFKQLLLYIDLLYHTWKKNKSSFLINNQARDIKLEQGEIPDNSLIGDLDWISRKISRKEEIKESRKYFRIAGVSIHFIQQEDFEKLNKFLWKTAGNDSPKKRYLELQAASTERREYHFLQYLLSVFGIIRKFIWMVEFGDSKEMCSLEKSLYAQFELIIEEITNLLAKLSS